MSEPLVFFTAAERSGDDHAAGLIRALRRLRPGLRVEGHGGRAMTEAGATVHRETTKRAVMGLRIVYRVREVLELLKWTRRHWQTHGKPDLLVCCDSWSMNKHFLRLAREMGVPTMYYVAPQLWANREGRVKEMRRLVDRVACILPFEEAWLRERGIEATFVGHPLFDELADEPPVRQTPSFADRPPVIALAAGSRRQVARNNFPLMLQVARRVRDAFPGAQFVSPTTDVTHPIVSEAAQGFDGLTIKQDAFDELIPQCDFALTASGTAVLHIAGYGVPMVAVYAGSRFLWHALGRWVIKTRTFTLVNLLHPQRKHVVPEFIPWFGQIEPVADKIITMLRHPEQLDEQRREMSAVVDPLRQKGAGENAARIALSLIESA